MRVLDGSCIVRREEPHARSARVRTDRLLATTGDGAGRYYRFIGYAPRTGYATHAYVIDSEDEWSRVACPEWHPGLAITIATRSLPTGHTAPGTWLACRADLSADAGARVCPHQFVPAEPGFDPSHYPAVDVSIAAPVAPPRATEIGPGCGDVVLFVSEQEFADCRSGPARLHVNGHPPPLAAGGRAYLHANGEVHGWRPVHAVRPCPNGTFLELEGAWHPVILDVNPRRPPSGVVGGRFDSQAWLWRSWPRSAEV
jgi:hypothetical protein